MEISVQIILFTVGVVLVGGWWVLGRPSKRRWPSKVVEAKSSHPVFGNALEFTPKNILKTLLIYPRIYGPVVLHRRVKKEVFLLTDAHLVREVFGRRPKGFRRRRAEAYPSKILGFSNGLFSSNGELWSRLRRATAPSFNVQNVKYKFNAVLHEFHEWMDQLTAVADGEQVLDFKLEAFRFTIRIINALAFGMTADHPLVHFFFSAQFLTDVVTMFRLISEYRLFPLPHFVWRWSPQYQHEVRGREAAERFNSAARKLLAHKREMLIQSGAQPTAMVDFLIERGAADSGSREALSEEEVVANVKTFYTAGAETTSIAITWAAYALAVHTEAKQKLRQEVDAFVSSASQREQREGEGEEVQRRWYRALPLQLTDLSSLPYTAAFAKEILRMYAPPVAGPFELVDQSAPLTIGADHPDWKTAGDDGKPGITIYPDQEVWLNVEGLLKDPKVFAAPLSFQPDRWLLRSSKTDSPFAATSEEELAQREQHFLTFGSGPRVCPGMHLANLELHLAVLYLSYGFDVQLACPVEEIERVVNFAATINKLPVKLTKRVH